MGLASSLAGASEAADALEDAARALRDASAAADASALGTLFAPEALIVTMEGQYAGSARAFVEELCGRRITLDLTPFPLSARVDGDRGHFLVAPTTGAPDELLLEVFCLDLERRSGRWIVTALRSTSALQLTEYALDTMLRRQFRVCKDVDAWLEDVAPDAELVAGGKSHRGHQAIAAFVKPLVEPGYECPFSIPAISRLSPRVRQVAKDHVWAIACSTRGAPPRFEVRWFRFDIGRRDRSAAWLVTSIREIPAPDIEWRTSWVASETFVQGKHGLEPSPVPPDVIECGPW